MLVAGAALVVIAIAHIAGGADDGDANVAKVAASAADPGGPGSADPLAFREDDREDLERRAALGSSHVLYAKSPGGVQASAVRTAAWRDEIDRAAEQRDVNPDTLEAIVFLESAGRSQVIAGTTPEAASGLAQILPGTATSFLGMTVDLPRSIALTARIDRASNRGDAKTVDRLVSERSAIDERFDPKKALEGAATYLRTARDQLGADDLAIVSYHMGIGNLQDVIKAYGGEGTPSYARLFFDSSPQNHSQAWELLSGFGDDSALYLWRVLASRGIMELWRRDADQLQALADLATEKATLEEVYHPRSETEIFAEPDDVAGAHGSGDLVSIPAARGLGFKVLEQAGELAPQLGAEPELYRALRPEALTALVYLAAKVRAVSGVSRPLQVTSAVRDEAYQALLTGFNPEATRDYSLHTTGYSFDIRRKYASSTQASAVQFALDRLRAHAIIDYAVEPAAIHVTVADAAVLLAR